MPCSRASFVSLPPEILCQLLRHASPQDLPSVMGSCRYLYSLRHEYMGDVLLSHYGEQVWERALAFEYPLDVLQAVCQAASWRSAPAENRTEFCPGASRLLLHACKTGKADWVRVLLSRHSRVVADPTFQDCASLRYAALNGHLEAVLLLLDDGRVDVNAHDGFALKWAVRYGHVKIVQALRTRQDGDIEMLEGLVKYAELRGDNEMLSALGRGHVSPSRSPISTPLRRIQSRRPLALAA